MSRVVNGAVDRATFDAKLAARMGPDANAELGRLRNDPVVREYIALGRPAALAGVALLVLENLGRYALLQRIRFVRPVRPVEADNTALLAADPSEETYDKVEEFIAGNNSAALARYLELVEAAEDARKDSITLATALRLGPVQMMAGVGQDLAEVCVGGK
jgi:hypothetical protein